MFTKQDFIKSAVLIWIIGSVVYIGWDAWNDYKIRGVQQAYQAGINDSAKQIFDKSQANQWKQPVEVTLGENKMEVIDVKCLQQSGQQPSAQQQGGQPQSPAAPAQGAVKK